MCKKMFVNIFYSSMLAPIILKYLSVVSRQTIQNSSDSQTNQISRTWKLPAFSSEEALNLTVCSLV